MADLLAGKRVLVVEDEMMVLMMIENALADLGCECIRSAATVAQALALLDAEDFDAATLDVNLNGTASYEVADALAALGVPFVFSTGYPGQAVPGARYDRPVLHKPYSFRQFETILAALFDQPPSDLTDRPAGGLAAGHKLPL